MKESIQRCARWIVLGSSCVAIGCQSTSPERVRSKPRKAVAVAPTVDTTPSSAGPAVSPASDELLDFTVLSGFDYREPLPPTEIAGTDLEASPPTRSVLPTRVRALDGQVVRLRGFMVPLDLEDGHVHTFLLLADHRLCCGQGDPRANDMVEVKSDRPLTFVRDTFIEVRGKLEVGEVFEYGYLSSLYRLQASEFEVIGGGPPPPDPK